VHHILRDSRVKVKWKISGGPLSRRRRWWRSNLQNNPV